MVILEMFHGMTSPHGIADMLEARSDIQPFRQWIPLVDKQPGRNAHVCRLGNGNTQQLTGNSASTMLLVHGKTV